MLRRLSVGIIGIFVVAMSFTTAQAQWAIGGSYEIRNEVPETGFGVRIEKGISLPVPLVNLGIRASASHFSEENTLSRTENGVDFNFDREVTTIDYGLTVLGKLQLGLVKPYVGIGIGGTTSKMEVKEWEAQNIPEPGDIDKSELNYHGLIGGEFSLVPMLNPFIEYRVNDYSASLSLDNNYSQIQESNGRLMFGVMLRF